MSRLATVFNTAFRRLFKPLAAGAAERADSVVMTIGDDLDPSRFVALPANVHVRRDVPLDAVLQRADGAISHAGWGTLTSCASAGVPLAPLALGAEHSYNAAIAQRAEFGFGLNPLNFDQSAATEATGRLLSDRVLQSNAVAQSAIVRELPDRERPHPISRHRFG